MKKITLLLALMITTVTAAQDSQQSETIYKRDTAKNELSLNVFNILIFGAIDGGYERILSDYSSISLEVFSKKINKNEGEDFDLSKAYSKEFSLTTKFKYFFQERNTAWGFYAEGFAMYSDGFNDKDVEVTNPDGQLVTEEIDVEYTDVAIGVGVGGKFVAKKGFLLDLSFGFGRNMFNRDSPDLVVVPNINVGYRF